MWHWQAEAASLLAGLSRLAIPPFGGPVCGMGLRARPGLHQLGKNYPCQRHKVYPDVDFALGFEF